MEKVADEQRLLEIYKVHAQAADDVSRRRDSANRMYLGASTAVGITMGVTTRVGTEEIAAWVVVLGLSCLGVLIQLGWLGVIDSYRQLNGAKFNILLKLEEKLEFDFYTQEYEVMGKGKDKRKYHELTLAERTLPRVLGVGFAAAGIVAIGWRVVQWCTNAG